MNDAAVTMSVGDRLILRTQDHIEINVKPGHWDQVRQAMKTFVEEKRDALLELNGENGMRVCIPASRVVEIIYSTPENRRTGWELEKVERDEDRENRVAVGLPPEEEF